MSNIKIAPTEWIYFFEEPTRHKGLIELGRTKRSVEDRNRDKRSVDPWKEIASYPVIDCEQAEKKIIRATKNYQYNGRREILEINWSTLKAIVEPILNQYSDLEYKVSQSLPHLLNQWDDEHYWPSINEHEARLKTGEKEIRQKYSEEFHHLAKIKNLIPEQGKGEQPETFFLILGALMFFLGLIMGTMAGFGAVGLVISIAGALLCFLIVKISEPKRIERDSQLTELHKKIDPKRNQEIKELENSVQICKGATEAVRKMAHFRIDLELRDALKKNKNLPLVNEISNLEKIKNPYKDFLKLYQEFKKLDYEKKN